MYSCSSTASDHKCSSGFTEVKYPGPGSSLKFAPKYSVDLASVVTPSRFSGASARNENRTTEATAIEEAGSKRSIDNAWHGAILDAR
jgi:hypothetical protein